MRGRAGFVGIVLVLGSALACGGGAGDASWAPCTADADCAADAAACQQGVCDVATGSCGVRDLPNGEECAAGAVCYAGDCLTTCERSAGCADGLLCASRRLGQGATAGLCVAPEQVPCADDAACLEVLTGPCEAATCDLGAGRCHLALADDGVACDGEGACYRGQCYPSCAPGPEPCATGHACLEPRAGLELCVPEGAIACEGDAACAALVTALCRVPRCVDGACVAVPASNGAGCADGRTCWAGACVGAGACSPDGTCASQAACVAGVDGDVCVASDALSCAGSGDCASLHTGACQWATCGADDARCHVSPAPDGGACGDGGLCLAGACAPACADSDACAAGTFCRAVAGNAGGGCADVPCTSPGDCADLLVTPAPCEAVTCNTLTNRCQVVALPDNASCDDGDLCNGVLRCRDGACVLSGKPVECTTPPGQGCTQIACDPPTGACVAHSADDGLVCDDGSPCTSGTTCQDGICTADQVTCTTCTYDQDCLPGDDGDLCNGVPLCLGGACVWSPLTLIGCAPPDDPCQVARCEPATGACLTAPADDGAPCAVSTDLCAARSECQAGQCVQVEPAVTCPPSDDACLRPACDPASGQCGTLSLAEVEVLVESFDVVAPLLALQTQTGGASAEISAGEASSPPGALHVHVDGALGPSILVSEALALPADVALAFSVALRVQAAVDAGDLVAVEVGGDAAGWQALVLVDAAHPAAEGWAVASGTLSPLPADARLRVRLDAVGPAGLDLWLDDVRIVRPCP